MRSSDRPFGILPDQRGCRLEVSAPFRGAEGPDQQLDPLTVRAAALPNGAGCDKADPFRAHPAATRGTRSPTTNGAGPSPRNHRHDRRSRKKDGGIMARGRRTGRRSRGGFVEVSDVAGGKFREAADLSPLVSAPSALSALSCLPSLRSRHPLRFVILGLDPRMTKRRRLRSGRGWRKRQSRRPVFSCCDMRWWRMTEDPRV
jgi:hypothetical protein